MYNDAGTEMEGIGVSGEVTGRTVGDFDVGDGEGSEVSADGQSFDHMDPSLQ